MANRKSDLWANKGRYSELWIRDGSPLSTDLYIDLGPTTPYVPNGGGIVIEPYNGTTGGGSDNLAYARVMFNPEKANVSVDDPPDVILSAHKYHSTGALHEHFSIYTSNATGTLIKRLDVDYLQDTSYWIYQNSSLEIDNDSTDYALHIHQDGTLDNNKQALFINWTTDNTSTNASAEYIYSNFAHTNTNTVNSLLRVRNDNSASRSVGIHIDQDGNARALDIDHNNTQASIYVDHDFNNASDTATVVIDPLNAGAGKEIAFDISTVPTDAYNFKVAATADIPTVTWGAAAGNESSTTPSGYLKILVGSSARYIPFWA